MSGDFEIKIAVVDDKLASAHKVKEKLEKLVASFENVTFITNHYESGVTFLASKKKYDLILLDYEMPYKNGIQVARELEMRDIRPHVIFNSGYAKLDKPMQRAMQIRGVFGFIFKSDSEAEFQFQMKNALKSLMNIHWIEFDYYLVEPVDYTIKKQREKRIYYHKKLDTRKITYIKTTAKDVVTISTETEEFMTTEALKELFNKLPPKEFEYSERGVIINLVFVHSMSKKSVYLTTDDELPLKPKYREIFRKSYDEYLLQGLDYI